MRIVDQHEHPCASCGWTGEEPHVEVGGVALCPVCVSRAAEMLAAAIDGAVVDHVVMLRMPARLRVLPGGAS